MFVGRAVKMVHFLFVRVKVHDGMFPWYDIRLRNYFVLERIQILVFCCAKKVPLKMKPYWCLTTFGSDLMKQSKFGAFT